MAFNTSDNQDAMSEINVTPLVDVMLVLVIILLVTAPLVTQSVHVALPKTVSTTPDVKDEPLQVAIDAAGIITLNKTPYPDLPALEKVLQEELAKNPEAAVQLHADKSVIYEKVAKLMATVQHSGIGKMAFVTEEE